MSDLYCSDTSNIIVDDTLFRGITSMFIDPSQFNIDIIRDYLCQITNLPSENIDPILFSPEPLDYSDLLMTSFRSLTGVGDPRISLGHVLSAGFNEFLPIILAKTEIIRNGGCSIVENYICDVHGDKIKRFDFYCPSNINEINYTPEYIIEKVTQYINDGKTKDARNFANYIISLRNQGWSDSLWIYKKFPIFYVRLNKQQGVIYKKYHTDTKDTVAQFLGRSINIRNDLLFDSSEHFSALMEQIPLY